MSDNYLVFMRLNEFVNLYLASGDKLLLTTNVNDARTGSYGQCLTWANDIERELKLPNFCVEKIYYH